MDIKWYRTNEKLPQTNRQILLLLEKCAGYDECYEMPFTNIIMGVFIKNKYFGDKDIGCSSEREYYFEGLCCEIHLPIEEVLGWAYVPTAIEFTS